MLSNTTWTTFFERCFEGRVEVSRFSIYAKLLYRKQRAEGSALTKALIATEKDNVIGSDPLTPLYAEALLELGYVTACDLLTGVLKSFRSRHHLDEDSGIISEGGSKGTTVSPQLEQNFFGFAYTHFNKGGFGNRAQQLRLVLKLVIEYMSSLKAANTVVSRQYPEAGNMQDTSDVTTMSIMTGTLAMSCFESPVISATIDGLLKQATFITTFADSLLGFQSLLTHIAPHLASRIEMFIQAHDSLKSVVEERSKSESTLTLHELQLQVPDGPSVYNRASLLVHLDSLFFSCPHIDQNTLIAYLQARYKGDIERAMLDLIVANFDLLVLKMNRQDSEDSNFVVKSFTINKLPLIVAALASVALMPLNVLATLSQTMDRVDPVAPLREDFVHACALHGLLSVDNIELITGTKLPSHLPQRANKATLLQQYRANAQQVEVFLARLQDMDGNAATYADAIVDVIHNLATERHTMPLKTLCHNLAAKAHNLDVLAMTVGIERLLSPICHLLDTWSHDEDHGEYQPVYDEFGACFLFVHACVERFGLKSQDIASLSNNSFVAEMMISSTEALRHEELSQAQQGYLTDWARALFETEGISDELMAGCPPQEFYRIVGSLFRAIVTASRRGALSGDKLRNGLELLLEPFLLPAILCATPWLEKDTWARADDAPAILSIMKELIKPSGDPTAVRNVILNVAAQHLEQILLLISSKILDSTEVNTLQQTLAPFVGYAREGPPARTTGLDPTMPDLMPLNMDFKLVANSLSAWGAGLVPVMPRYSHASLLKYQHQVGTFGLFKQLMDMIKMQMQTGLGDSTLDLVVALICALQHGATTSARTNNALSLQQAMLLEMSQAPMTARAEPLRTQILIRIGRRVQAELTHAQPLDLDLGMNNALDPMEMPQVMDLPMPEAPAVQVEMPSSDANLPAEQPAISFDEVNDSFNLDIEAALAAADASGQPFSAIPGSAEDDIFAGLTFDTDMDFS